MDFKCSLPMDERKELIDKLIENDIFKTLSEPVRLQIIKYLVLNGESDITTIAEAFPQDRSVISRHLQNLERAGMLSKTKQSRHVFYSFKGDAFLQQMEQTVEAIRMMVYSCDE